MERIETTGIKGEKGCLVNQTSGRMTRESVQDKVRLLEFIHKDGKHAGI